MTTEPTTATRRPSPTTTTSTSTSTNQEEVTKPLCKLGLQSMILIYDAIH